MLKSFYLQEEIDDLEKRVSDAGDDPEKWKELDDDLCAIFLIELDLTMQ